MNNFNKVEYFIFFYERAYTKRFVKLKDPKYENKPYSSSLQIGTNG